MASFTIIGERGGDSASLTTSGNTATRVFILEASAADADPYEACLAPGIPVMGVSAHPKVISMRCSGVAARRVDPMAPLIWEVTVNYATPPGSGSGGGSDPSPLAEKPVVSWGARMVEVPATKTADGKPVVNSAGRKFDNPPVTVESHPVVTVIRNQTSFSAGKVDNVVGSVNKSRVTVAGLPVAERKGLLEEYSGERIVTPGLTYWRVTYRVVINPLTWDVQVADTGYYDENGVRATDDAGAPTDDPKNLDGNGAFADVAAVLKFRIRRETDWGFGSNLSSV